MIRFLLVQKITPLVNRYEFFAYDDGKKGERISFVEQKRLTMREAITAWKGEDKNDVLFTLKAEKVLDIHGRFMVRDQNDQILGYLKKAFGASLLRSTWEVHAADDTLLFNVTERNLPIALIRRFGGFIPVLGEFLELLPFNFDFMKDGAKVGTYSRVFSFRDTYDLRINDTAGKIDDRLAMALGIALDALQAR